MNFQPVFTNAQKNAPCIRYGKCNEFQNPIHAALFLLLPHAGATGSQESEKIVTNYRDYVEAR
jgi:hypothetical protein